MSLEDDFAVALEQGHIGFAHLDAQLTVASRQGVLSGWLPADGAACSGSPILFGLEEDLLRLPAQGGVLTLPSVHVAEFGDGRRADVVIHWDARRRLYVVITIANFEAGEIETLLTAERRNKQMSDERLIAETERANVQTRINAIAQERARMARDLHDTLIQTMVGLLTQIRLIRKIAATDARRAWEVIGETEELARRGLDDARGALGEIRAAAHDFTTLGAMIRNALSQLRTRLNIDISLHMDASADDLHGDVAHGVARIVEEALRNIERHARARTLEIVLKIESAPPARYVNLSVIDNGVGFDLTRKYEGHFGLTGMREQAELLGGDMTIETGPGKGARIDARIPLPRQA